MSLADKRILREARQRGWLEPWGNLDAQGRQRDGWALLCREHSLDCLTYEDGEFTFEPHHTLSPLGWQDSSKRCVSAMRMSVLRNALGRIGFPPLGEIGPVLLNLLRWDRSPNRALELRNLHTVCEGMARVLDPEGLWPGTQVGDAVYIREIPGCPGRCLALRHLHLPLVDVPLAQFSLCREVDT